MARLVIINKENTFNLQESYEYPTIVNRHYAFTGGGPMSPSYYGFDELIDFSKVLGTSIGFIQIESIQNNTDTEGTPIQHRIIQEVKKENGEVINTNTSVPLQKLKVHMDWQDRTDRIRTVSLFFKYSKDGVEWYRLPLQIRLSENVIQDYH